MFYKCEQLIYKALYHRLFCLVSRKFESNFLTSNVQARGFKTPPSRYNFVKLFSTSFSEGAFKEYKTVLHESKKLCIDIPYGMKVKHIDPQLNHVENLIVRVFHPEPSNFRVDFVESEDNVSITGRFCSSASITEINTISLEIEIPFNHDVKILCEQGNVCVSNLRSDNITVQVINGNINCKNLYCSSMFFSCFNGNINCEGILQGNINMKIKNRGNVNGFNFQGSYLRIETENGDIIVSSTYSDESTFLSTKGNLVLRNLHRRSSVFVQKGSLVISGLDGSLDARVNEGNINVQVSQLNGESYVETKNGNVILGLAKEDLCQLNLSGKSITIKNNLGSTGEINYAGNCEVFRSFPCSSLTRYMMVVVSNNGEVHLEKKNWISSFIFDTEK